MHCGEWSRRDFLLHATGVCATPLILTACKQNGSSATDTPPPPLKALNLDEVVEPVLARPAIPKTEPIIRVRVMRASPPGNAVRIGSANQWLQVRRTGGASRGVALCGPLTITITGGAWSVVDAQGFHAAMGPSEDRSPIEIAAAPDQAKILEVRELGPPARGNQLDQPSTPSATVRQYPGLLRLVARVDLEPGSFDLINDLPLETYLPGVLAGELYKHWHLQTFAAQCVAARSFACTEIAVFAGKRHYDVTNTASSQMYVGNVKNDRAHEATALTRGLVLGYGGLLVSGYYSSCCGGLAASAKDVIGSNPVNDVEALKGRPEPDVCTTAPVYKWSVEQPIEIVTRRLVAYGKERRHKELSNFTRLASVEVIAKNANGRPTRMRIVDDHGSAVELSAENFRRALNYSGQGLSAPEKPLRSSYLTASFKRDTVLLEGYGFGHGVGLCQYGAETLAKSGKKFEDILRWYYPGVEIVAAY